MCEVGSALINMSGDTWLYDQTTAGVLQRSVCILSTRGPNRWKGRMVRRSSVKWTEGNGLGAEPCLLMRILSDYWCVLLPTVLDANKALYCIAVALTFSLRIDMQHFHTCCHFRTFNFDKLCWKVPAVHVQKYSAFCCVGSNPLLL